MKVRAGVFGGAAPVLPHVTWPIDPYDDESLAGFTVRTCSHNGLWDPSVLLADVGLRLSKGFGHLPRASRDLSGLATLLAVNSSWVDDRRHRTLDERCGRKGLSVDFHGATLRRVHLDYFSQRVAPTAILEKAYHREIWNVLTLAACSMTGEVLVEACQQPGCGKTLGWGGPRGIGNCSDPFCKGTISSLLPEIIPEAHRSGLALAASLIHPSAGTNSAALAAIPACLKGENRGDLFELAWLLGCLDHREGLTAITAPASVPPLVRSGLLSSGAERLLAWPACLAAILSRTTNGINADTRLKLVVETLQAIVRKPTMFGRSAALLAAEVNGISTNASATVGQKLGLLTATEFAHSAGVSNSRMAVLQRSTHLPRILLSEGGRDIALFSPSDARDVRRRIKERLPAQVFASEVGLGIDAVEQLIGDKVLLLADDPVVQALWPETYLDRVVATGLRERITRRLRQNPAPEGSIRLSAALYGCAAGDKPWPAIIHALLAGRLGLHKSSKQKLDVRSCLVSQQDVRVVRSLCVSETCDGARSEWLSEADARERLSCSGKHLRSLSAANKLSTSGTYTGLTYRRSEVDAIGAAWVSLLELQARLGQSHRRELNATLRGARLVASNGFVFRSASQERLGLLLGSKTACTLPRLKATSQLLDQRTAP